LIAVGIHMSSQRFVRGAAIAATLTMIFMFGLVERGLSASADAGEVSAGEVSAAEQLRLKAREGNRWMLSQTVATAPGGVELFGFNEDEGILTGGRCHASAGQGYLGFRRVDGTPRLLSRLPALATPPVIGGGREAVVGA
jgi:hypothetical protein